MAKGLYKTFYKNLEVEVEAQTSLEARNMGALLMGANDPVNVAVVVVISATTESKLKVPSLKTGVDGLSLGKKHE